MTPSELKDFQSEFDSLKVKSAVDSTKVDPVITKFGRPARLLNAVPFNFLYREYMRVLRVR